MVLKLGIQLITLLNDILSLCEQIASERGAKTLTFQAGEQ